MKRSEQTRDRAIARWIGILSLAILGALAESAAAATIAVELSGTVTGVSGSPFGVSAAPGGQVSGKIMYDTSIPASFTSPNLGAYFQPPPNGFSFVIGGISITSMGTVSFQVLNDSFGVDGFNAFSLPILVGGTLQPNGFASFSLTDFTQTAFSSVDLPMMLSSARFGARQGIIFDTSSGESITFDIDALALSLSLHGAGGTMNPPTLFLDDAAPTGATPKSQDSSGIAFNGGNVWKEVGTWRADPRSTDGVFSGLTPLRVWLGLKNSDDRGTQFDLRADVEKNGVTVASGTTRCITGITRTPAAAKQTAVSFPAFPSVDFNGSTDVLNLKILARIGTNADGTKCSGPGGSHSNAVGVRLYFDAVGREAAFGVLSP